MSPQERLDVLAWVEKHPGRRTELLAKLGIAQSTYYAWRKRQQQGLPAIGAENLPDDRKPALLSDNGSAFKNKILAKFCRDQKVRQIHGAVMHPQTQGEAERLNRRIKEVVNLREAKKRWTIEMRKAANIPLAA